MTGSPVLVGVLGSPGYGSVDERGAFRPGRSDWSLDWWIGADDRWRLAAHEAAVRQTLVAGMPVARTAMRVPGGDAVHHAYAVHEGAELAVVEIANESPAPFVVALVVRGAHSLELDGTVVVVDGRAALRTARPPSRWAAGDPDTVEQVVVCGDASDAAFPGATDRRGRLCGAFLYPVAHRTALRAAVALDPRGLGDVAPASLPSGEAVARGWRAQLDRGMRVELPDAALQEAVDGARAAVLLAGQVPGSGPEVVAALEDWGFDAEARAAWARLRGRERRRAAVRSDAADPWAAVNDAIPRGGAGVLLALRRLLVRDDQGVAVLTHLPEAWRGQSIDVRDAPTRHGPVSFAVRWHGEHPALLWDVPDGVVVRAPALDADWSSDGRVGEALLGV